MECMKRMECPKCGGRVFDISKIPREQIQVVLKCPKCRNIVAINITSSQMNSKPKRN
jgi:predicted nucleic-acid-binding Zn-ribbon protein